MRARIAARPNLASERMATPEMPEPVRTVFYASGGAVAIVAFVAVAWFAFPPLVNPHSPIGAQVLTGVLAALFVALLALVVLVPRAALALWRDAWIRTRARIAIVVLGAGLGIGLAALFAAMASGS